MFNDLLSVFFPKVCLGCSRVLLCKERMICTDCRHRLPFTEEHNNTYNLTAQLFFGRCNIKHAASLLYFDKGSLVQKLLHNMKYKNHPELGILFGEWMGEVLKSFRDNVFDIVVPVPISKKRLRKRGYNQVALFAEHIAKTLNIPFEHSILTKNVDVASQVSKTRAKRSGLADAVFGITSENLAGKHVLLVDDLVTSGNTLEACINVLHKTPNIRVSIATIAVAK